MTGLKSKFYLTQINSNLNLISCLVATMSDSEASKIASNNVCPKKSMDNGQLGRLASSTNSVHSAYAELL